MWDNRRRSLNFIAAEMHLRVLASDLESVAEQVEAEADALAAQGCSTADAVLRLARWDRWVRLLWGAAGDLRNGLWEFVDDADEDDDVETPAEGPEHPI